MVSTLDLEEVELYKHHPAFLERQRMGVHFVREIFGNPFRPIAFLDVWRTPTVLDLARTMYEDKSFDGMPILADAIEDAGAMWRRFSNIVAAMVRTCVGVGFSMASCNRQSRRNVSVCYAESATRSVDINHA